MTQLFKKAEVTSARLKMGLLGFAGSGKTFTATDTAIGLIELLRDQRVDYANKPLFFLDTETGSDWIKPKVEARGIELFTAKTRAFTDLLASVTEAEKNGSVLLIDSISHFWKELCDSYMKKKNRTRLQFEDWGFLKSEWSKFTDAFINSDLHIILCGRAGYEYDYFQEEGGKKHLEKTGIKMKAEGEMGYEPSLLVLMEREMNVETNAVWRTASVLKDRSTLLDGKEFQNPSFKDFLPHVKALNLAGKQLGVDTTRNSEHSFSVDKRDWQPVQRKIAHDEITTLLQLHFPGQTAVDKTSRLKLLLKHFDASWTEIEEVMPLQRLREGYDSLYRELEKKPSKYAGVVAGENAKLDDELPTAAKAEDPLHVHAEPKLDGKGTDWTSWAGKLLALAMAATSQDDLNAIVFANAETAKTFEQESAADYARFADQLKALQERFLPQAEQSKAEKKTSKAKEPVAA